MQDPTFIDAQRNADLMDTMADYAFELEEAMREAELTEIHWVCVGYDTRKMMNDALGYMADTALQAEAICRKLHPNFDIYYTKRCEDWEKTK